MAKVDSEIKAFEDGIDVGRVLLAWEAWDTPPTSRSVRWYVISGALAIGLLVYAVLTNNYIFALIVVMFAVILIMRDLRKPTRVQAAITTDGVVFNNEFYAFKEIRDFAVIYEPPLISTLYLNFNSRVSPTMSISLDDSDPNEVRAQLLPYAFENLITDSESLTDTLARVYKL